MTAASTGGFFMPKICTCGTTLPDDARFCYRCGRPQFEEAVPEQSEPVLPIEKEREAAPRIGVVGFGDPLALRTALLVAGLTTLLQVTPLFIVAPAIGGFLVVFLYMRRTGRLLTPRDGAKLGWMSAVLNLVPLTLVNALAVLLSKGAILTALREQIRAKYSDPAIQQMASSPVVIAIAFFLMWIFMFGFSSLLHVTSGALTARVMRRR